MIRTLDFNAFAAGTEMDDEYFATDGVTISATGGSGQAMIFDSNNPTGGDDDLASDTLDGLLIISEDGDECDPDDNASGGSIFFDFEDLVRIKSLTFKDIEETSGDGTRMIFYDANDQVIKNMFVSPTGDGGESTVQLFVPGVARMEVRFEGSGAIDNLVFDDAKNQGEDPDAVDDLAETDEDTAVTIDLRGNDSDPNNSLDELTIGSFVSPNGTVTDNGDGTVEFMPDENFNGEATFTYTLTDPNGNTDTATVTVQVNPINDAPVANDDEGDAVAGEPVIIDLRGNDTDVETPTDELVLSNISSLDGEVVDNGDGTVTFTPDIDFEGTASIFYTVNDADGGSDTATALVQVMPAPDTGPTAVDDTAETDEDTAVVVDLLGNDTDPDNTNAELSIAAISVPADQGTVTDNGDGTVTFTPAENFNGEATITYTVSDPDGQTDEGVAVVTVNPVNDAPDAVNDADATDFNTPITVDLLANDTDVETPDDLTVTEATVPVDQGTLVDNDDGTVTFTPADGFEGEATISYTIEDPEGASDSAVHIVDVGANPDTGPTAVDDVAETQEDVSVTIDLLGNDTDPDNANDELSIAAVSVPADQGTVTDNGDGTVTFTPAENFNGEATITYTVADPDGQTDDGEAIVTVTPVNDAPVTMPDAIETDEDTASEPFNVLDNDSDPEGGALELLSATSPDGTVEISPDGEIIFTPNDDFNGETTIEYFVSDPEGAVSPGSVTVTVNPVNDDPVAVDDTETTPEETPVIVDLIGNDTDVDGDILTLGEVSVPEEQGTLVDNGDGTVTFTPADDFVGEATITYTVLDGNGGEDEGEAIVTVTPEADAPIANPDTLETDEDTPSEPLNVLANDTDPDGDPLELLDAVSPDGAVSFTPDGEVIFTPNPDFNGETTITYTVTDPTGLESTGTVTVTVNPVNDAPVAVDDVDVTPEDEPITVDLLANDSDVDGDELTVVEATVPADQGTLVDNGDGTVTFTPAPDFVGEVTISYTIEDEEGLQDSAEHTVYVNAVSDEPVAMDDTAETDEDTPVTIDVLANDTDPDGDETLFISDASVPEEQGTVEIVDGELVFTPADDFNGEATITYTAEDPDGNESEASVTVTVNPVNDAPVAEDDSDVTDINTPVTVDLLANDSDVDGDPLTVTEASVPADQGTLVDNGDGTVTFTPADDFVGDATISYTITDGTEEASAEHIVNVSDPAQAPTANPDMAETPEDTPVTIDVLENDTDPQDDPLTISEASVPEEQGTVEIVDNELVFTPAPDFNGPAEITYTATDPDGNAAEGTVTVDVTPLNDAPVAEDDEDSTDFNTPVTVDLLANDSDVDGDDLVVSAATVPADQGTVSLNGDGTALFTPADGFSGEAVISYTIEDEEGLSDSAVHVVTVGDNDAPVAVDDEAETPEDESVVVDLLGNDTDENGDELTLVDATVPEEQGTLVDNGDGTVTFTPAPDFNGPATITYTVADPSGATDEGQAVVDVVPVNDPPVAVDDFDTTDFETPVTVDLLANDTDVDGDELTVIDASVPADQGTLVDNGDGTVTFTPADDFLGDATISYTIADELGEEASAVHVITVNEVDNAPVAVDDIAETDEDTPVTIDAAGNDTDPNGDPLTIIQATVPEEQGTVEIVGGELVFTPAEDFSGPVDITYIVEDPDGNADEGTVRVNVNPVNDAPDAVDDVATTEEDTPVVLDLVDNDSDPDGDPLTVTAVSVPAEQGTVVDNGDGTATFTPAPDFVGEATITYTIEDPDGEEDTAEHVVTVTPINDAPDAVDDVDETDEDTPITVDLLANDTDVDGDDLRVIEATVPEEQGTLVDNGDGTVTFTPAPDFNGPATITYTISDGQGGEDTAEHVITVGEENDPPVTEPDTLETDEDTPSDPLNVLDNDSDPDGDPLTLIAATSPDGTVAFTPEGEVIFTPDPDFNGETTIDYIVTDPSGVEVPGTVTVTVNPVNDAPDAVDDADTTDYNTPVTVDLLANDTDPEDDPLTVIEATVPEEQGTLVDNGDGTVTFTPVDGFVGDAIITYTIEDEGGLRDTAEHLITVEPGERDGIVEGTDGDDLIDVDYRGDPDGDVVDGEDAIIPGQEPNDDIILAGEGDDTVLAGEGDDSVTGGEGDDSIFGEDGNDTVDGGDGDDVIDTGNGDLAPDLGYPFAPGTDPLGYDPDTDPENDRDSVNGGDGDDTISTGDDRDTISGGDGDDVINAGIDDDTVDGNDGDDRIVGGEGNDTINGGFGNDTIYAGNDPDRIPDLVNITDEPSDDFPFSPDRNPDNGRDLVNGGAGDDLIFGADDDDTLLGGSGNDTIDGEIDDDSIEGGTGDDSLIGGQGNDTLRGNRNDDTLIGGIGDDVLDGGGEDDLLEGGDGDDSLQGAQGDDTMRGGDGNDTMTGGAGQDLFEDVGPGDVVDGGSGPIDMDTLDLRGSAPEGGSLEITYTSDDREDGIVNYFDEDGEDAGQLVFEEIETIIPCFTPGTKIATPKGERLVEELQVGDRVITRDNGIQEIRWVGARDMTGAEFEKAAHLKPVLIRQGALGNDLPERDMMVSPNHRVLVANDKTALYFEEREVLVAAKHLTGLEGVDIVDVSQTTYIHIMFDQHEVILSDGSWTESFQPGDMSLAGIGNAQRQEILELFPELATQEGIEGYASARRSLKKHEAKLITK